MTKDAKVALSCKVFILGFSVLEIRAVFQEKRKELKELLVLLAASIVEQKHGTGNPTVSLRLMNLSLEDLTIYKGSQTERASALRQSEFVVATSVKINLFLMEIYQLLSSSSCGKLLKLPQMTLHQYSCPQFF